ncbi:MAG: carbonic anhydrase family protein [Chloroflexota bacterium]
MNILSRNPLSTTIAVLSLSATILGIHANQATASLGGNATPPPTTIANSADGLCATPYTIKTGDTLSLIAKRSTGNIFDYVNIVRVTNDVAKSDKRFAPINNINVIRVGQMLCLAKAKAAPAWAYNGDEGPAKWGDLSSEFAACKTGQEQSPIDLSKANLRDISNISFNYQPSKINILNNGHTIQVNYDEGSYIVVDGKRYDLLQYHFHAPSEHSVNGKLADAEVHFVHKAADGTLAVVGVLLVQGPDNASLKTVWDNLPTTQGPVKTLTATTNAKELIPPSQTTYRYNGSLTTPPCSEGVKWHIMTQSMQLSAAQLKAFTNLFPVSNRPIQPLFSRTLDLDSTP